MSTAVKSTTARWYRLSGSAGSERNAATVSWSRVRDRKSCPARRVASFTVSQGLSLRSARRVASAESASWCAHSATVSSACFSDPSRTSATAGLRRACRSSHSIATSTIVGLSNWSDDASTSQLSSIASSAATHSCVVQMRSAFTGPWRWRPWASSSGTSPSSRASSLGMLHSSASKSNPVNGHCRSATPSTAAASSPPLSPPPLRFAAALPATTLRTAPRNAGRTVGRLGTVTWGSGRTVRAWTDSARPGVASQKPEGSCRRIIRHRRARRSQCRDDCRWCGVGWAGGLRVSV